MRVRDAKWTIPGVLVMAAALSAQTPGGAVNRQGSRRGRR